MKVKRSVYMSGRNRGSAGLGAIAMSQVPMMLGLEERRRELEGHKKKKENEK